MTITLFGHQIAIGNRARAQRGLLVDADCGTGKTIAALAACNERWMPTLVLAPPLVMRDAWVGDAQHFPQLRVHVYHGTKRHRQTKQIDAAVADGDRAILVTTHETFRNDVAFLLERFRPGRLIIDESSKIKNHDRKAKLAAAAIHAADKCREVMLLSGTPAPKDEADYWTQLRCIDPRPRGLADAPTAVGGGRPFFLRWAGYYLHPIKQLVPGQTKPVVTGWKVREDRRAEFESLLARACIQVREEDCQDLPELREQPIYLDLSKDERRVYEDLVKDAKIAAHRDGGDDTWVSNVAGKLRQVTAGVLNDGEEWRHVGASKLEAMAQLVESFGNEPFLVWTAYREEAARAHQWLRDLLGDVVGRVDGSVSPARSAATVAAFKAGELRALVAHPASMGHGVTLTRSGDRPVRLAIRMSFGTSWELHRQSIKRFHRTGQTHRCVEYQLVARQSIDLKLRQSLEQRSDATQAMRDAVRELLGLQTQEVA